MQVKFDQLDFDIDYAPLSPILLDPNYIVVKLGQLALDIYLAPTTPNLLSPYNTYTQIDTS